MKTNGFTLIELLIAIGLTALFLPALVFVFSFSLGSASQGENYTQAYALAQGNNETIYYLKENSSDWNWTLLSPLNTSSTEYYQPSKPTGSWILGSKTPIPHEVDGYTTTVQIFQVERNISTGNITEGQGDDIDPKTRKIVVNVAWKEKGEDTSIDLVSYVSRH